MGKACGHGISSIGQEQVREPIGKGQQSQEKREKGQIEKQSTQAFEEFHEVTS
jgi:hypothetical protein